MGPRLYLSTPSWIIAQSGKRNRRVEWNAAPGPGSLLEGIERRRYTRVGQRMLRLRGRGRLRQPDVTYARAIVRTRRQTTPRRTCPGESGCCSDEQVIKYNLESSINTSRSSGMVDCEMKGTEVGFPGYELMCKIYSRDVHCASRKCAGLESLSPSHNQVEAVSNWIAGSFGESAPKRVTRRAPWGISAW